MNRLDRRFAALAECGRRALIPYITAGHPHPDWTVDILHAAVSAGADVLELGVPFSDVMADGPVIQNACARALEAGTDFDRVLAMVEAFRRDDEDTPIVLMGYMNPIERRGQERFASQARQAGVDAVLVVDCPADEAEPMRQCLAAEGLHQIFLVAPTTTPERLARICNLAGGFVYYVSLKGVTGAASLDLDSLAAPLSRLRKHAGLPIAVGFGIREPAQAAAVARMADGVVIGSALVNRLDRAGSAEQAVELTGAFLGPVRAAMDAVGEDRPASAVNH